MLGNSAFLLQTRNVSTLDGLEPTFNAIVGDRMEAVIFSAESLFYVGKKRIAELALARKLACCGYVKEVLDAGVLISYGADQRLIGRRTAYYVDRILKGEKPADMPVEHLFGKQWPYRLADRDTRHGTPVSARCGLCSVTNGCQRTASCANVQPNPWRLPSAPDRRNHGACPTAPRRSPSARCATWACADS
jgi:ABC transporter substrate binding protein